MIFKKNYIHVLLGLLIVTLIGLIILRFSITPKSAQDPGCGDGSSPHASLASSSEPALRKLSEYEAVCKGPITDTMMLFTAMPASPDEVNESAKQVSTRLKEFAKQGIKPLVLFEPNASIPNIISDIRDGGYDPVLMSYFQTLKKLNITDEQMGTWVLFPEANTPAWENTDAATFAKNVTRLAAIQREVFPVMKLSILLNATTYPSDDISWGRGEQKDLRPYVASIPKGTIDSFGYQGFPFLSPANAPAPYGKVDAKDFLPPSIAYQAAAELQTREIWINTGSFRRIHTDKRAEEVTQSSSQRQKTLSSVVGQAAELQDRGFNVSINIFAEDKSNQTEHTDWSYWPDGKHEGKPDELVFKTFLEQLHEQQIKISLYDSL